MFSDKAHPSPLTVAVFYINGLLFYFTRAVGLRVETRSQTAGNERVSVLLNPASSFTTFLISQLRGTNYDFSWRAADHKQHGFISGNKPRLSLPFPWRPCRRATARGRRTSPPKPARRPATRRARPTGPRGSRLGVWAECVPGGHEDV